MTDLRMDPKEMIFYIKAQLECGANIEIFQRDTDNPWEFIVVPKPGTAVEDFCSVKNGVVKINMTEGSAIGLFQLMGMCAGSYFKTAKKKFLGIF